LAVQKANIAMGNLNANAAGSLAPTVSISSGGTVTFGNIDTSGFGGASSAYSTILPANPGGNGGSVTINARGAISGNNILSYGGGGAGGGGAAFGSAFNGQAGGAGGDGANVNLFTSTGNINLTGMVNSSGGGGGGGGGGSNNVASFGGIGGAGGQAAPISI